MESTRDLPVGPAVAVALAGGSALSLGLASWIWTRTDADEAVSIGLYLVGWTLLAFAATLCAVCLVDLVRRLRTAGRREVLLVAAAIVLIAATMLLHPLTGSGSGGSGVSAFRREAQRTSTDCWVLRFQA